MAFPIFVGITPQSNLVSTPNLYAVPSGTQAGDLLFVMASLSNAVSHTLNMPAGWTLIQENPADSFRDKLVIGFIVHDGSSSYSFSSTSSGGSGVLGRIRLISYRGQAASNPINSSAAVLSFDGGTTLASTPIAAAAGLDSIEILFAASLDTANTSVSGSGVTSRANSSTYVNFDLADAPATAGSNTTPKTFTWGAAATKRTVINVVVSGTAAAATPVSFSGTVNSQSATVGTAFNLNLSSFFAGSLTPFTYSLVAGSLAGTGLSLDAATGVISGTPSTAGVISGLQVQATDTGSNTAQTNTFSITVQAAGIGSAITYTVPSRTFAAAVTATAPTVPSFTLTDLANNSNAPWANTSGITIDVYNVSTGALVVRKTGLTSTAGADLVVSDAALVVGTTYNVVISIGAAIGAAKVTAV